MPALLSSFDKRKVRVRDRIKDRNKGGRPRISVFRSNKNIYAQLIDDKGKVIKSYSSLLVEEKDLGKGAKGVDIAKFVGDKFAKLCIEAGITEVVFDKGAYLYNGRVKALAESCREAGLKF
jgi:large subunit ribosomal protein L18